MKELGSYYVGATQQDELELKQEYELLSGLLDESDNIVLVSLLS